MKLKLDEIINNIGKWLPLQAAVVDSWIEDRAGIYLISRDQKVIYVGRSDVSVRRRLINHCGRFDSSRFITFYCDPGLGLARLEYNLIEKLNVTFKLENKVNASIRI